MIQVGITGGIGAGKTTVCGVFSTLGIPVYHSDERARYLMEHDPEVMSAIRALIGEGAYSGDKLDRGYIASRVFGDRALLDGLNAIVHPAVHRDFAAWVSKQDSPYVLQEAAILFESGAMDHLDRAIVVTAPEELRLERAARRDGSDREQIRRRMANQMSEERMVELADYVIRADDSEPIIPQVLKIHEELSGPAGK